MSQGRAHAISLTSNQRNKELALMHCWAINYKHLEILKNAPEVWEALGCASRYSMHLLC